MSLFEMARGVIAEQLKFERLAHTTIAATAIALPMTALLFPHQPVGAKNYELLYGSIGGFASAYCCKSRERKLKIDSTFEEASLGALRQQTKLAIAADLAKREIEGELELVQNIAKLPIHQQARYIERYNLQGLIAQPVSIPAIAPPQAATFQSGGAVAEPDNEIIDRYINPQEQAIIQMLAETNPKLVRVDDRWIQELIDSSSQKNMSSRANHHFYLCAETQGGKSTLAGVLINGIVAQSEGQAIVAGHDPKKEPGGLDITRWLCKFTYKVDGIANTDNWLQLCQKLADDHTKKASKIGGSCQGLNEFILVQDEVDTIYGNGKGFGEFVGKETAEAIASFWAYGVKYQAGLRGHMFFMGQSPLTGDNSFKRPSLKNLCFIALGQTSSYILQNPKDFLNHVSPEEIEILREACKLFESMQKRYALVRPTRGNSYVALIPEFNVDAIDSTKEPISKPNIKPGSDPIAELKQWAILCLQELGRSPNPQEVREAWKMKVGQFLTDEALTLLCEQLGIKND